MAESKTASDRKKRYQILIDVEDEKEQAALLLKLQEAGFVCKPLVF